MKRLSYNELNEQQKEQAKCFKSDACCNEDFVKNEYIEKMAEEVSWLADFYGYQIEYKSLDKLRDASICKRGYIDKENKMYLYIEDVYLCENLRDTSANVELEIDDVTVIDGEISVLNPNMNTYIDIDGKKYPNDIYTGDGWISKEQTKMLLKEMMNLETLVECLDKVIDEHKSFMDYGWEEVAEEVAQEDLENMTFIIDEDGNVEDFIC